MFTEVFALVPLSIGVPLSVSTVKNLPANARDVGSIPGSVRSPGEGNGNPLQYPCLENSIDRATWRATVSGVTKSWTWLSDWAHTHALLSIWPYICSENIVSTFIPLHLPVIENTQKFSDCWTELTNDALRSNVRHLHHPLGFYDSIRKTMS